MEYIKLNVEGMKCVGCENRIKNALINLDGIENVVANHESKEVKISLNNEVDETIIKETISDLGFEVVE